jgi:hypothetical protein
VAGFAFGGGGIFAAFGVDTGVVGFCAGTGTVCFAACTGALFGASDFFKGEGGGGVEGRGAFAAAGTGTVCFADCTGSIAGASGPVFCAGGGVTFAVFFVALSIFVVAFTVFVVVFIAALFRPSNTPFSVTPFLTSSVTLFTAAGAFVFFTFSTTVSTAFFGLPRFFSASDAGVAISSQLGRKNIFRPYWIAIGRGV